MTVQEAIEKNISECKRRIFRIKDFLENNKDANSDECRKNIFVLETIIQALKEVEQYRALGTVEELKEAKEKQIPKSPALSGDGYSEGKLVYDTWECPNCGEQYEVDYDDYDYCPNCGQAIDRAIFY